MAPYLHCYTPTSYHHTPLSLSDTMIHSRKNSQSHRTPAWYTGAMVQFPLTDDITIPSEAVQSGRMSTDWTLDNVRIYGKPLRWYVDRGVLEHFWVALVMHDPEQAKRIQERG